jgi:perosamine synthetase
MIKFPVYRPDLSGREREYVNACLESSWISSRGEFIARFEESFARFVDVPHALSVSNGTVALHVALLALSIGPGDEVIVPTFTYVASVNAIRHCGATPVFVDSVAGTWQIDPHDVERRITSRTKAVMVVHLYGHSADMTALMAVAQRHGLRVVEDCAEAIGTQWAGRHVGGFGDVATFSFFGNKTFTTGEGGMVVTADAAIAEQVMRLKGQGLAAGREYWHDVVGYNYRMTNICAAIGVAQLERAPSFIARKKAIAKQYARGLSGLPLKMHGGGEQPGHSYWMVSVLLDDGALRDSLRAHLLANGIETRPTFFPVHTMPMYAVDGASFPVAESLSRGGVNLPSYPGLTDEDVECICGAIARFFS